MSLNSASHIICIVTHLTGSYIIRSSAKKELKSIYLVLSSLQIQRILIHFKEYYVGNKAKGRISKRVFQENKARQIFKKTNISYPLVRTHT